MLTQTGDTVEQIANMALFSNVQSSYQWSGTELAPDTGDAWFFRTFDGFQVPFYKTDAWCAVAVRPGDVAASVSRPQTLALALLAWGATAVGRRRRSR